MGLRMSKDIKEAMEKESKANSYFYPAGDLNDYFKVAGDLETSLIEEKPQESGNNNFHFAGELKSTLIKKRNIILEEVSKKKNIDINNVHNTDELLNELFECNSLIMNEIRDKKSIADYLEKKKKGNKDYMRCPFKNVNVDLDFLYKNTFNDNGSGIQISGKERKLSPSEQRVRGCFDYRITMRNSNDITTEEAISFINTLVSETNRRGLSLRAKNYWEADAFILYCDKEYLYETVKLLEDLSDSNIYGETVSNATKHFGALQPFSASLRNDSYYGISMAHSELAYGDETKIKGSYGAFGDTFNGYIEKALDNVYAKLCGKYNGNADMIDVDEFYNELVKYHKKYMLGGVNKDIPLWMNRRNYVEYMLNSNKNQTNGFDNVRRGR